MWSAWYLWHLKSLVNKRKLARWGYFVSSPPSVLWDSSSLCCLLMYLEVRLRLMVTLDMCVCGLWEWARSRKCWIERENWDELTRLSSRVGVYASQRRQWSFPKLWTHACIQVPPIKNFIWDLIAIRKCFITKHLHRVLRSNCCAISHSKYTFLCSRGTYRPVLPCPGHFFRPNRAQTHHTLQSVPFPSTFSPQSPVYLTSVSALYLAQALYSCLAPAWLEVGSVVSIL